MKKFWVLIAVVLFSISCDDGDIIVTSFDFDEQTLQRCTDFDYVFFKINTENNETLALQFTSSQNFLEEIGDIEFSISGSSNVTYRRFSTNVTSDYFCNPIPPTSPTAVEEFRSDAGDIRLVTTGDLADTDGIPSDIEDPAGLLDSDEDGTIDILDFDDDGDNVPTSQEGVVLLADGSGIDMEMSRDTDMDGILDYLDPDDDGDGVLTRNEDLDMDLNPTNDRTDEDAAIADYLNPQVTITTEVNAYREHSYTLSNIEVDIILTNLDFRNENGEEVIRDTRTINYGTFTGSPNVETTFTPDFN